MKTSNKILLTSGLVIVSVLLASVIGSRIFLNKFTDSYERGDLTYPNIKQEYKDIIDFTDLDIVGDWNITINQGSRYSIYITGNSAKADPYKIEKKGTALFLTEKTLTGIDNKLKAVITMPEIGEIYTTGGVKLELTGFHEPELILDFTGGTWITGNNSRFENLLLTSAGAINLEFEDIKTVNADVRLSGAGNLILNMDGGILTGDASGAINIEYLGNAKQSITAAGLTSISQRN